MTRSQLNNLRLVALRVAQTCAEMAAEVGIWNAQGDPTPMADVGVAHFTFMTGIPGSGKG